MIGNDVVDLELARTQSNWQRKGFLDKIFTFNEKKIILEAEDPEIMIWNLWTRKEAAYKIFNRCTQIRAFIPLQLECNLVNELEGTVCIKNQIYWTKTEIKECSIYSVAVTKNSLFSDIKTLSFKETIQKENGIPFIINPITNVKNPVSISHHGRFWKGISLPI